jgi:hypothetical protein
MAMATESRMASGVATPAPSRSFTQASVLQSNSKRWISSEASVPGMGRSEWANMA